jgi:23S rRNA (pseudouridine1915-N3)-methyltransferase
MQKITIICLGKFKEKAFIELEKEYLKRLSAFAKINLVELKEVSYREGQDIESVKLKEATLIQNHIPENAIVILLEEKGAVRNSQDFANFFGRITSLGQEIVFIIGSGIGLHESMRGLSNYQISLSPLTFTHNFARVLLEEQIYRAFMINANRAYHK